MQREKAQLSFIRRAESGKKAEPASSIALQPGWLMAGISQ